jgi:predicted RNase H-like HicB family nuclease
MNKKKSIITQVKEILRKPYSRVLIPQEEGGFSAEILEFPGCIAEGETVKETYSNLEDTAKVWIRVCLKKKEPIPPPLTNYANDEKMVSFCIPRSLYKDVTRFSTHGDGGTTPNKFMANCIALQCGKLTSLIFHVKRKQNNQL